MKIPECPFTAIAWDDMPCSQQPGKTGFATQRQFKAGDVSVRRVEYSPGYSADHWCERGHIAYIVEGELVVELKDGRSRELKAGMSFISSDDRIAPHRALTTAGAVLFLVD